MYRRSGNEHCLRQTSNHTVFSWITASYGNDNDNCLWQKLQKNENRDGEFGQCQHCDQWMQ